MKHAILAIALLYSAVVSCSQSPGTEFTNNSNGLIYDDTTISRLKHIVDSLHIRYRKCDQKNTYYSIPQTRGHYILLNKGNIKNALTDIQNNISFQDFKKKYPKAFIDDNVLIAMYRQKEDSVLKFVYLPHSGSNRHYQTITLDADKADKVIENEFGACGRTDKWVYDYSAGKYTRKEILAFFMETPLRTSVLPERYAARILYVDCMVDTTTTTFLPTAKWGHPFLSTHSGPKYKDFVHYVQRGMSDTTDDYFMYWGGSQLDSIMDNYYRQPQLRKLFTDAVEEALQFNYITSELFEYYTQRFYSKGAALALMRNRYAPGSCSMDPTPRQHVFMIAQLAAELAEWQVFLRAHLDVMNDNITRSVDASYAKRNRYTYVKELEELDINVHELMIAICFEISNAAGNHYFGNVSRLGRAFAEAKDRGRIEQDVLSIIADNELDDLNRLRMHYLFLNYIYYLDKKEDRLALLQKLEEADKKLPFYMYSKLEIDKESITNGVNER